MSVDIEKFLNPIDGDNPCGKYLCYDIIYDDLKELRREDDPRLSQGVWQTEIKRANWTEFISKSTDLLCNKTKDLQIAVWLTEAFIIEKQFEGFIDGLKIMKSLIEKFWDHIYPMYDKDDYNYRLAPFYFLSDKIIDRLVLVPLTNPEDSIVYSLADWMEARRNMQIKKPNGLSISTIGKQVAVTPIEYFQKILNQEKEVKNLIIDLRTFLEEKCPQSDTPSFIKLLTLLDDIIRITEKNVQVKQDQIAKQQLILQKQKSINQQKTIEDIKLSDDEPAKQEPTIAQAYDALRDIVGFLERKQPQSPSATLLKVAIKLGKRSFQEILDLNMESGDSVLNTISELYRILYKKPKNDK